MTCEMKHTLSGGGQGKSIEYEQSLSFTQPEPESQVVEPVYPIPCRRGISVLVVIEKERTHTTLSPDRNGERGGNAGERNSERENHRLHDRHWSCGSGHYCSVERPVIYPSSSRERHEILSTTRRIGLLGEQRCFR